MGKGSGAKAMLDFDQAIRLAPRIANAYRGRGVSWFDRKEYDKAIADYTEAIRLDPRNAWVVNRLGDAHKAKKDYDKALTDYSEAIRLDPSRAHFYSDRAVIWKVRNEYDKAIADYNDAIRLNPRYAIAFQNRGQAWRKKQDYDKAIADFTEAIRLDTKLASAYDDLARLLATCATPKFRNADKALEMSTQACKLTEFRDSNLLDTLAAAYAENSQFEQAVETQRKAIGNLRLSESLSIRWQLGKHFVLYKNQMPYRENPRKLETDQLKAATFVGQIHNFLSSMNHRRAFGSQLGEVILRRIEAMLSPRVSVADR